MSTYLTIFAEQCPYFSKSTIEDVKDLNANDLEMWNQAEDPEWCRKFAVALDGDAVSCETQHAISYLQQTAGKANIIYYLKADKPGFRRALALATKDHNILDSDESWIIPFKTRNGIKLQYVPSIHAQYADWQMAKPDCSLYIRCWTIDELKAWIKATPHRVAPGADDAPVAADDETRFSLATAGPKTTEIAGCQVIKIQVAGGTIARTSFWHSAAELDEYAQNHGKKNSKLSPWGGFRSKTDPIEMYKKTARRIFIKNDAGPVMLRTKTLRG